MKIFLILPYKNVYNSCFGNGIIKSFRRHFQNNICTFDYRINYTPYIIKKSLNIFRYIIGKLFNKRYINWITGLIKYINVIFMNRCLRKELRKFNPDCIFVNKGELIGVETFIFIKKRWPEIKILNWMADTPDLTPQMIPTIKYYDKLFLWESFTVKEFNKRGYSNVELLPFAIDEEIYKKVELSKPELKKYQTDILFVGSYSQKRHDFFCNLSKYNLNIWGPNWYDNVPENSPIINCIHDSGLYGQELVKVLNAAKIVVNVHDDQNHDGINQRTCETTMCGTFILDEYKELTAQTFIETEEIIFYYNIDDLKQKIDYYLKNDSVRETIAERSRLKALNQLALSNRLKTIFNLIQNQKI